VLFVVSPLLLVSVTLILVCFLERFQTPSRLVVHVATVRDAGARASSRAYAAGLHAMTDISRPDLSRQERTSALTRRYGGRDPLRHHRAIVGRDARTPFFARIRAVVLLLLIVIGFGAALAGITLVLIASGRILLEILAG